jgi:hypothetical protein
VPCKAAKPSLVLCKPSGACKGPAQPFLQHNALGRVSRLAQGVSTVLKQAAHTSAITRTPSDSTVWTLGRMTPRPMRSASLRPGPG